MGFSQGENSDDFCLVLHLEILPFNKTRMASRVSVCFLARILMTVPLCISKIVVVDTRWAGVDEGFLGWIKWGFPDSSGTVACPSVLLPVFSCLSPSFRAYYPLNRNRVASSRPSPSRGATFLRRYELVKSGVISNRHA